MPGAHSKKQRRQARHVADSERKRGKSPEDADRIAWATVNARKAEIMETPILPPPPPLNPPDAKKSKQKSKLKKDLPAGDAYAAMGKAGKTPEEQLGRPLPKPPKQRLTVHTRLGRRARPVKTRTSAKSIRVMSVDDYYASLVGKAMPDNRDHPSVGVPSALGAPKKFPRRQKPTVKMKPITDEEAMTNLRAGKHIEKHVAIRAITSFLRGRGYDVETSAAAAKAFFEKADKVAWHRVHQGAYSDDTLGHGSYEVHSKPKTLGIGNKHRLMYYPSSGSPHEKKLSTHGTVHGAMQAAEKHHAKMARKALSAGYGKVSGGGALRAPNRGYPTVSIADIQRAMEVMPKPSGQAGGPPKTYLSGVHNPNSPFRPKKKSMSARPTTSSKESPRAVDAGGAALLAAIGDPEIKKSRDVVHKSGGDLPMAKTNFNDLFKSELAIPGEEVLCDCPHCDAPITKSDLEKAHGGKGKTTHQTGAKHGKSSAHVVDQNPEGGTMRGGEGRGGIPSSRGVPGAKKHDEPTGVQNSKGSRARKAIDAEETDDATEQPVEQTAPPPEQVKKSLVTVRGTEWVQWVDDGSDAALAKSIAEGALGGTPPTQPLDLNNDLTRLLV